MPTKRKTPPATICDRLPEGQSDCLISQQVGWAAMDLSRNSAIRLARTDPSFPSLRLVSPRRRAFVASEVVAWIRSRPVAAAVMPPASVAALAARRAADRQAKGHAH